VHKYPSGTAAILTWASEAAHANYLHAFYTERQRDKYFNLSLKQWLLCICLEDSNDAELRYLNVFQT